jgi:diguanylate cyclase
MISEIFMNSCILITFISVSQNFIKNKDVNYSPSFLLKFIMGIWAGLLGILLMLYSVKITPTIITDFRALPILLSAVYGGVLPSIIASIIIAAFRIWHFGISYPSILAVIAIVLMGIGFSLISTVKVSRKRKWIYSIIYSLTVNLIPMIILLKDSVFIFKVFIAYSLSTLIMSYFAFKYTEYINESVGLFKKFKNEATVDFLTGLNNVRQFDKIFNIVAQQAIRNEEHVSLIFLDIDLFKRINDTYGHSCGDIILKDLADILRTTCRVYDIVSRNGGEEFSVLLNNSQVYRAMEIAERIRKAVETNKFYISNKTFINITISIGVSTYPSVTQNLDELSEHADNALYKAKRTGRNKVVLYSNETSSF